MVACLGRVPSAITLRASINPLEGLRAPGVLGTLVVLTTALGVALALAVETNRHLDAREDRYSVDSQHRSRRISDGASTVSEVVGTEDGPTVELDLKGRRHKDLDTSEEREYRDLGDPPARSAPRESRGPCPPSC